MAGGEGVKALFSIWIDVGADDKAHENYVVARDNLLYESTFEIGDGIGEEDRIDFFSSSGFAGEFGEFVDGSA